MSEPNMPEKGAQAIRLNRYLASCGLGSRRAVERLITAGHVLVNGLKVSELGTSVTPGVDRVEYKGSGLMPVLQLEYAAYHKPRGVVVTAFDPHHERTIYDDLSEAAGRDLSHLKYVGRLDKNSEGLLILTNDGALVHTLTHPKFHVAKLYEVLVSRPLTREECSQMTHEGIESEDVVLKAAQIWKLQIEREDGKAWYRVELREGKKRQIRRMFEGLGAKVHRLIRVRFGPVALEDLPVGALRALTTEELDGLKRYSRTKVPRK